MNRPPALDGPPISVLPGVVWGTVQTPSTSTHSGVTAHTMAVAPRMTSTSPSSTAPDTSCSPNASMVPGPTTAPAAGRPAGSCRSARCPTPAPEVAAVSSRPASFATPASQPVKSNSGSVVMATTVSIAPTPARAWLATAWAGQYPAASGWALDQPGEEAGQLAGLRRVGRLSRRRCPGRRRRGARRRSDVRRRRPRTATAPSPRR